MNITKIEGIGPVNAARLEEQGITTVEALLKAGAARKDRKQLAEDTGLSEVLILDWVNRADLMRIPGVGEEYSDLLEQAGVDTVKELRRRNPDNLREAMLTINYEKQLVRRFPGKGNVREWVRQANELPPVVTY